MPAVCVYVRERDLKVGAMLKALAVETSGFHSVAGANNEFLEQNGYFEFTFPNQESANSFKEDVEIYLKKYISFVPL